MRAERLTATERVMLHNSHTRPAEDPLWMASYNEARHIGWSGSVLWELGMRGQYVAEARHRLTTSNATRGMEGHRARTRGQIKLVNLLIAHGDPVEAATLGHQAVDWAGGLHSRGINDGLRDLRRLSAAHHRLPAVADLRDRIHTVLTAA